ncbi:MAG: NADH-quinone oxidoreductase subunit NuoN [Candidatus Dadabacteria bacterium]|nr:NADH-quinone oxidoreductase subunit NuoN [Candidatus Dadabacteria bacterium]NIX16691.1 NADH-quinone oxidoreductase subunit NuoN [Candidatus Dadabacteria bacterium]
MEALYISTLNILPELSLIIAGLILLLTGPFLKKEENDAGFFITLIGILIAFYLNFTRFTTPAEAFAGSLSLDSFTAYFNSIFLIGSLISVAFSRDYLKTHDLRASEFYTLILFATSGMMFLSSAREFMSLFLSFEIMSISVYVLTALNRNSLKSTEAGIKYLILGGFSSAILLFGIALVYGATGSIVFTDIADAFDYGNPMLIVGVGLIFIGFIFKIGAFPLHQWVPDIYEGAPVTVTGFMSVGVKAAAFAVLLRAFLEAFPTFEANWLMALWVVAVFTMTIGNVSALLQNNLKRLLAFSSIAHAGYAIIGIASMIGNREYAFASVNYYLLAYMFMNLGAFGILAYLSKKESECETFDQIAGLWDKKPAIATALTIFMVSLAGIPPFLGFFAKYKIFLSAIEADLIWLAVIGIINSVISAYYYLKVIVYMYMKENKFDFPQLKVASSVAIAVLCILNLFLGIFPLHTWDLALKAANSIPF